MGSHPHGGAQAPRSIEEGVDTIVWLATLPDGGADRGFFRDRQPIGVVIPHRRGWAVRGRTSCRRRRSDSRVVPA